MALVRALEGKEKEKIKPLISRIFPNAKFSIKNSDVIFIYEKNSAILGFAHLRKYHPGTVLLGFGVVENFRSQGIGKYLLSFVVSSAEKSHKPIYLKVKKSNRAAVSVYKSFGFKIIKSKSGVYVMKRTCFS